MVIVNWIATLFLGTSPEGIHNFLGAYLRYAIHVGAYFLPAAEPSPDFLGKRGHPVDVEIDPGGHHPTIMRGLAMIEAWESRGRRP